MGEIGRVSEVNGESAVVLMERTEACAKCGACAVGLRKEEMRLTAQNVCGAAVGEFVRVELRDGAFIQAALALYGLPLAGLLAGVLIGSALPFAAGVREALAAALGAGGLALGYLGARAFGKARGERHFTPMAMEIVPPPTIPNNLSG